MTRHLYSTEQIQACEIKACLDLGLSELDLMERAGKAAFQLLKKLYPCAKKILIYCGSGKNSGDGYVLARLAQLAGYSVHINQYKLSYQLPDAACSAAISAQKAGVNFQTLVDANDIEADVIVDALLGTGLTDVVREPLVTAINQINDSNLPILSLDIPSGLNANTGAIMGTAVKATATLTFLGKKLGLYTLDGRDCCGALFYDDLKLSSFLAAFTPMSTLLSSPLLSARQKNSHKHQYGHVLIVGGNIGMFGAVLLAAKAALRAGAGMVSIATHASHAKQGFCAIPEAMFYALEEPDDLTPLLDKANVCVIGPGLGTDAWAKALFEQVISTHLPMIIDAGALRLLAESPQQDDHWILTPHPGEAASLLGWSTQLVQDDRYNSAKQIQHKFGGVIVLKGNGTIISHEQSTNLCAQGNPGMATAGMGDCLSGIIAALAAQGMVLADAAKAGVWLHASAADAAAKELGERGLVASDIYPYLHRLVNN